MPQGGSVVSVGVFDGVHLGHQAILAANRRRARELGASATSVTFAGHPKGVLLGHAPLTLTSLNHRLELFRQLGMDHTLVLRFDERLRQVSAEEFVRKTLVHGLGARAFVLGFDSKFGHDREGTPEKLQSMGLDVEVVDKVLIGARAVSSTAIREAVTLGDLTGVAKMLGRPYSVLGTVVAGDGVGRKLGFPTANLDLHQELHPPLGVYAGWVRFVGSPEEPVPGGEVGFRQQALHPAVANIGLRPTLGGGAQSAPRIEVHLLDFQGQIYGRVLEFAFEGFLRAECKFSGLAELSAAIAHDLDGARQLLARGGAS